MNTGRSDRVSGNIKTYNDVRQKADHGEISYIPDTYRSNAPDLETPKVPLTTKSRNRDVGSRFNSSERNMEEFVHGQVVIQKKMTGKVTLS